MSRIAWRRLVAAVSTVVVSSLAAFVAVADEPSDLGWRVSRDPSGRLAFHAAPMEARFRNEWPEALEAEFQARARHIIGEQSKMPVRGANTYFENEKRTYGYLMAQALGGHAEAALRALQGEDHQREIWHRETAGIDYYACFTLKHQMRKYFYFGELLDPAYRQRMRDGARRWTEQDPLRRPHYAYVGGPGWGPDHKNSWVDVRSTENLFLMRATSVYLMAEETGNRDTAAEYARQLRTYAASLYRIGMGEWDSENYHGHSIAPLCNLYDFAKDPEVRRTAKACLDWLFTAGAVKYWRGGFNGPSKRDYNHVQPFGGSAASMLWVAFGDSEVPNEHWESDEVHLITSNYRPPLAVVHLARKRFARPTGLYASKATYAAPQTGDWTSPPEHLETQWFGRSYQLGSLAGGTTPGKTDVNGFKLLLECEHRGVGVIQCVPGPDPLFVGSPQYQEGKVSAPNRVAQHRNVAIWLVEDGSSPWTWVLPDEIAVETRRGVTFLRGARTWIAIRPLALREPEIDDSLTELVRFQGSGEKRRERWPHHRVLTARGSGGAFSGFVLEVGEAPDHESYESFRDAVLTKARLDASGLSRGLVEYTSTDGRSLQVEYGQELEAFRVVKEGVPHDWGSHARVVYGPYEADAAPVVHQVRGSGELVVRAGGEEFRAQVGADGRVRLDGEEAE